MTRLSDWEPRLADYLANALADIPALGEVPCARFAAGAVEAQTGVDHYAQFRGKYRTANGAARALRKIGAGDLESTFDRYLTAHPAPAFAQRGDIVFNSEAVGVCIGSNALFIADGEAMQLPRGEWVKAWATESAVANG
jgi:hypothetical protein